MPDRFPTLRAPHPVALFIAMFIISFAVQWFTWNRLSPFDALEWQGAAQTLSTGQLIPTTHFVYGYPATTIIGLSSGLIALGTEAERALRISIGFWYSFFAAVSVVLAYLLRPKTAWWALAGCAFLMQSVVYYATPPSSALGPMLTAFALFVLWALENKRHSLLSLALIGITGGIATLTRIDLGGLVTGTGILALSFATRSFRVFLLTSLIALLTFCALNPFMWHDAFGHLTATLEKIGSHAELEGSLKPDGVLHAIVSASFVGFFTFLFALTAPLHRIPLSVKKSFLVWACAITALLLIALTFSAHRPVWIFYPALFMWEIFLPLFAISAIPRLSNILKMNPAVLSAFLLGAYVMYYPLRFYLMTN